jgi:hypothetical protein
VISDEDDIVGFEVSTQDVADFILKVSNHLSKFDMDIDFNFVVGVLGLHYMSEIIAGNQGLSHSEWQKLLKDGEGIRSQIIKVFGDAKSCDCPVCIDKDKDKKEKKEEEMDTKAKVVVGHPIFFMERR